MRYNTHIINLSGFGMVHLALRTEEFQNRLNKIPENEKVIAFSEENGVYTVVTEFLPEPKK